MGALTDRLIDRQERALGADLSYLRSLADASTAAFAKFALAVPVMQHRDVIPTSPWHLARLGATRAQDCGTCLQIVVNAALAGGVPAETLRHALGDASGLGDTERLALDYGEAVASKAGARADTIDAVRVRFGEAGLVELALAVATVQLFPLLKRGLGQDVACSRVDVRVG
ncbi:MAG TPA: hypothetical protein VGB53_05380 [Rubricoccaceae bacterium]|jgi:alkylhydroperoxidase family enzyme